MHAHLEDLIDLRDDEPVDTTVAAHVAQCDSCSQELNRLRRLREQLRRLPAFAPPARLPVLPVARALDAFRPQTRVRAWLPLVAAASIVLAVLVVTWSQLESSPSVSPITGLGTDTQLESLVTRSQQLEALLRDLPPRPAVEQAATSATIDELQARIQLLDSQLLAPTAGSRNAEQMQRLWGERVMLMQSLVGMRYAEATRASYVAYNSSGEL